jgi:hypothetical protein
MKNTNKKNKKKWNGTSSFNLGKIIINNAPPINEYF